MPDDILHDRSPLAEGSELKSSSSATKAAVWSPLAEGSELKYNVDYVRESGLGSPLAEGSELKFLKLFYNYLPVSVSPRRGE